MCSKVMEISDSRLVAWMRSHRPNLVGSSRLPVQEDATRNASIFSVSPLFNITTLVIMNRPARTTGRLKENQNVCFTCVLVGVDVS